MNLGERTRKVVGYWFDDGVEASSGAKLIMYMSNSDISAKGDSLLYACGEGRLLGIVTLGDDGVAGFRMIYDIFPEYSSTPGGFDCDISRKSYRGMTVRATSKFIYVKLSMHRFIDGKIVPESYKGYPGEYFDEVEVYDWEGNFVRCIGTDRPFRDMIVSSDDSSMFVMSSADANDEPPRFRG